MKTKLSIVASMFLCGAMLCSCISKVNKAIVNGVLLNSEVNSLSVLTDSGDTLWINTTYTHPDSISGAMMVGDSVVLTYNSVQQGGVTELNATSVRLNPTTMRAIIVGTWVEPEVENSTQMQGIRFDANGTASAVNLADMTFLSWRMQGDTLFIETQELDNEVMVASWDTLQVATLNNDSLHLAVDELVVWRLGRLE